MSEYNVPEAIVRKVTSAMISSGNALGITFDDYQRICNVFAKVQSENPPVPTGEQLEKVIRITTLGGHATFNYATAMAEWVRQMYRAPELKVRPFVEQIVQKFRGVTLTPKEADYIADQIAYVTHGWDRGKETKVEEKN